MCRRRAQISMEYMLITGFVLVAILIPLLLFLFPTVTGSINSSLSNQNINDIGEGIVNDAKQMYYLGLYSHKIATYEIPKTLEYFYVLNIDYMGEEYYYLGLVINDKEGDRAINFQSEVPLISDESLAGVVKNPNLKDYVPECDGNPDYTCTFYSFTGSSVKQGKRDFKIETVYDNENGRAVTKLYPMVY